MIIIQWDTKTIEPDVMSDIYHNLIKQVSEKIIVLPKDLWVLQDVNKEYLTHIRDEINEILESGDNNAL
jgi:hypothetical protein